jgi:hypothetical protein
MIVVASTYLFHKPSSRTQTSLLPVSQELEGEKHRPLLMELMSVSTKER